jgi:hypothetical protein
MMSLTFKAPRRVELELALDHVLTPAHVRMVLELMAAERRTKAPPTAAEILGWLRVNMPSYAERIEELLHPAD